MQQQNNLSKNFKESQVILNKLKLLHKLTCLMLQKGKQNKDQMLNTFKKCFCLPLQSNKH